MKEVYRNNLGQGLETEGSVRLAWPASLPVATYRLQFNRDFTFRDAAALLPYLKSLGISHCYASPYLRARSGSSHGYDIVDHGSLNPEIGSREDYEYFIDTLHRHGMGHILDVVPNHVGIGGNDCIWWLDVLENGQASIYASHFDIDWNPIKDELRGKVLVPFLGGSYGTVLESGQIRLEFDAAKGSFSVYYYEHCFPIDPQKYSTILGHRLERLDEMLPPDDLKVPEFKSLMSAFSHLPERTDASPEKVAERNRDKEVHKRHLAALCRESLEIAHFIDENVSFFNGVQGEPASFDPLHDLLQDQPYRLASWRVASDEINYRRFFDVNNLASLRQEVGDVFENTHRFILSLIAGRQIDGLRIDHPDGLYDPKTYYQKLQDLVSGDMGGASMYLVVEKILAGHERLRPDWPVHGTTGYEFSNQLNGLFVDSAAEQQMTSTYRLFVDEVADFQTLLVESKKLIMKDSLASELNVLANYLNRISESDRHTRDFSLNRLRNALFEVVASFPVYRTYVTGGVVTEEDRRYIEWAVSRARRRATAADAPVYDFIRKILLLEEAGAEDESRRAAITGFTMKFQQYTAPITAKGLEDTAFYIYNRLISLNDVGGDPEKFGVTVAEFHRLNEERSCVWPFSLISTSTHDSKRGEDVRARINVLSEVASKWREHVLIWRRINRGKRRRTRDGFSPDGNDEYLLYQTLIGAWPFEPVDGEEYAEFCRRIEAYMVKAVKEAKVQLSWVTPNPEYEEGLVHFCRDVLKQGDGNAFLADFRHFQQRVAWLGMLNSLSQTIIKLTSPGIPDIYQGNEIYALNLVDPDNRRPVDYRLRRNFLEKLMAEPEDLGAMLRELLETMQDGQAKLYLTRKVLQHRNRHRDLYLGGRYTPLETGGCRGGHLVAFMRSSGDAGAITVAPRLFHKLMGDHVLPLGEMVWGDTWMELTGAPSVVSVTNVLTNERVDVHLIDGRQVVPAASLFTFFPVALLHVGGRGHQPDKESCDGCR